MYYKLRASQVKAAGNEHREMAIPEGSFPEIGIQTQDLSRHALRQD